MCEYSCYFPVIFFVISLCGAIFSVSSAFRCLVYSEMMLLASIWIFSSTDGIAGVQKSFMFILTLLVISVVDVAFFILFDKDIQDE